MIEFKKNVKDLLPYNRKQYLTRSEWFGVSFQLPGVFEGNDIGIKSYLEAYYEWFNKVISKLDNGSKWIVNHDFIDEDWFPNEQNNLKKLRTLFKQNGIKNSFVGALLFTKDDLLKFSKDLICYPYSVFNKKEFLYNDLDISQSNQTFVIKISGHLNIDFLSTDLDFLRKVVKENTNDLFILKEYRGTKL